MEIISEAFLVATVSVLPLVGLLSFFAKKNPSEKQNPSKKETTNVTTDVLSSLPREIVIEILHFVGPSPKDICSLSAVSKRLHDLNNEEAVWKWRCQQNYEPRLIQKIETKLRNKYSWKRAFVSRYSRPTTIFKKPTEKLWTRCMKQLGLLPPVKVIFVGLDNAGKTTLSFVLGQPLSSRGFSRSLHPSVVTSNIMGLEVEIFDLGGHSYYARKLMKDFISSPNCGGCVFVLDAASPERFQEAKVELNSIMEMLSPNKPIVILGNKLDVEGAVPENDLRVAIGFPEFMTTGKAVKFAEKDGRPIEVFMSSAVKRVGYLEALEWLLWQLE